MKKCALFFLMLLCFLFLALWTEHADTSLDEASAAAQGAQKKEDSARLQSGVDQMSTLIVQQPQKP